MWDNPKWPYNSGQDHKTCPLNPCPFELGITWWFPILSGIIGWEKLTDIICGLLNNVMTSIVSKQNGNQNNFNKPSIPLGLRTSLL